MMGRSYREIMKSELAAVQERNARYSLRSMAKSLTVSPSYLSMVLSGQRHLSSHGAKKFVRRMQLKAEAAEFFLAQWKFETARSDMERSEALGEISSLSQRTGFAHLSLDHFRLISEWYHGGLLELLEVKDQKHDTPSLAKRLGISIYQLEYSLDLLLRLGLIKKSQGRYWKVEKNLAVNDVPSSAIRKYHSTLLDKAKISLEQQSMEERDLSGVTMAIDSARLPEAKERIRKFRRELMGFLQTDQPDSVYHLSAQLFRIDRPPKREK